MKLQTPLLLVLSASVGTLAKVTYDGAKAMRISVGEDVTPLLSIIEKLSLPTWKGLAGGVPIANGHVDLVVPADKVAEFTKLTSKMNTEVMHEDLGLSIAEEGNMAVYAGKLNLVMFFEANIGKAGTANATWFNSYHPYADHLQFLTDLVALFPTNAEIVTSGTSNAGRAITGIHFWGSGGKGSKPAIVLHGTVHAREWITTMVCDNFQGGFKSE